MVGYVYCATNVSMPGLIKIGMTQVEPNARLQQLSGVTGVPTAFKLEWSMMVQNPLRAERIAHDVLRAFRASSNREFFRCEPDFALSMIKARIQPIIIEGNGKGSDKVFLGTPHYEWVAAGALAIAFFPIYQILGYIGFFSSYLDFFPLNFFIVGALSVVVSLITVVLYSLWE